MIGERLQLFRYGLGVFLLAGATLGLTACTVHQNASADVRTTSTHEPTPPPTASPSTPAPAFTPDPYWVTGNGGVYAQGQSADDQGAIPYAEGTATLNATGQPVSYTAAPGDVFTVIAQRFKMQLEDLYGMNCIRRNPLDQQLYIGDIVNLDPHTAISVGSQNGVTFAPTSQQRATCLAFLPPQH